MRNIFMTVALVWGSISPAQSALVYLNANEVMDTASGYVWLDTKLSVGLGFDNIYTQNGWRLAEANPSAPADSPLGLFESNFPGVVGVEFLPHNPAISELVNFLGGPTVNGEGEILAHHWSNDYTNGERDTLTTLLSYSNAFGEWHLFFDNEPALGPFVPTGNGLWLLRDATPEELAAVPAPPAVWLFGSALGVMGWMRRKATLSTIGPH